jgi:hypothetical protein
MALSPEASVATGLTCAALVYSIHQAASPTIADIRSVPPGQAGDIDSTRKVATWVSLAIVSGISLLTRDMTVWINGGAAVVAVDWWERHAIEFDPQIGTAIRRDALVGDVNLAANSIMVNSIPSQVAVEGMA